MRTLDTTHELTDAASFAAFAAVDAALSAVE